MDETDRIKGELQSNYIFLHFALIGLEWNYITVNFANTFLKTFLFTERSGGCTCKSPQLY